MFLPLSISSATTRFAWPPLPAAVRWPPSSKHHAGCWLLALRAHYLTVARYSTHACPLLCASGSVSPPGRRAKLTTTPRIPPGARLFRHYRVKPFPGYGGVRVSTCFTIICGASACRQPRTPSRTAAVCPSPCRTRHQREHTWLPPAHTRLHFHHYAYKGGDTHRTLQLSYRYCVRAGFFMRSLPAADVCLSGSSNLAHRARTVAAYATTFLTLLMHQRLLRIACRAGKDGRARQTFRTLRYDSDTPPQSFSAMGRRGVYLPARFLAPCLPAAPLPRRAGYVISHGRAVRRMQHFAQLLGPIFARHAYKIPCFHSPRHGRTRDDAFETTFSCMPSHFCSIR